MKSLHKIIVITSLLCISTSNYFALNQPLLGGNPYTYAPLLFNAENGITGRYWAGNSQYPGKVYIQDIEYAHIVSIKKSQLNKKSNKKLRDNKNYLGSYIDETSGQEFYLYGDKKNPDKINENPDADVITVKAISEDYGPGE